MGEHNCHKIDEHECIALKAYQLWKKEGCKKDNDLHYWLIAEKTVSGSEKSKSHAAV